MSYINWGSESPEQLAFRRQIEEQTLYEQAVRAAKARAGQAPGVGGSSLINSNPKAKVVSAKHMAIWYNDVVTGALKFFVANYEDLTFSEEIVLDVDFTSVDSIYYDDLVTGRGWIMSVGKIATGERMFHFIDAGGNLIETVITDGTYNDYSFDGVGSALSYTDPASGVITLKWWGGDTLYTRTFANVDDDYVYFDDLNYDSCTVDGTGTLFYYDTSLSIWRNFLFNFYTGAVIEFTDLLTYKGEENQALGMHGLSNFLYTTFQTSNTSSSTASYLNNSNVITLSVANTSIRVGDVITGPSIPGGTAVILNIVGATLTIDKSVTGNETSVTVDFNGNRMEIVRIIKTNGTYVDIDLLQYYASGVDGLWLVGTDKLIMYLYTETDALPDTLLSITCDGINVSSSTLLIDSAKYSSYNTFNTDKLDAFSSYSASPHGAESFGMCLYDNTNTTNDGKMWRYSPVMFVWTNTVTGEIYTHEPAVGVAAFNSTVNQGIYTQGIYNDVPVINPNGITGTGFTVNVEVDAGGNVTVLEKEDPGSGYNIGEQVIVPGNLIGSTSQPLGNITINITGIETFGINDGGSTKTAPAVLYVNSPSSDKLQILQLNQDGTTDLTDTVTLYADTSSGFSNQSLGDNYVLLAHEDSSQAPTIQFWGIWDVSAGTFVDNDWIFTTTSNSWYFNYDTFMMTENTEGKIYWWNSAQGDLGNTITAIVGAGNISNGVYLADENDYHDYVNYHQTGTTLILDSAIQGYLISSNFIPPALVDLDGEFTYLQLNKTHFYNLRQDVGNANIYVVDVYDLEGSKIQTVTTALDTYDAWRVVGDRVFLTQNDGTGNKIIYAISPTDYVIKTITDDGYDWYPNDWRYWD